MLIGPYRITLATVDDVRANRLTVSERGHWLTRWPFRQGIRRSHPGVVPAAMVEEHRDPAPGDLVVLSVRLLAGSIGVVTSVTHGGGRPYAAALVEGRLARLPLRFRTARQRLVLTRPTP